MFLFVGLGAEDEVSDPRSADAGMGGLELQERLVEHMA